jgi:hypothetical protein
MRIGFKGTKVYLLQAYLELTFLHQAEQYLRR